MRWQGSRMKFGHKNSSAIMRQTPTWWGNKSPNTRIGKQMNVGGGKKKKKKNKQ